MKIVATAAGMIIFFWAFFAFIEHCDNLFGNTDDLENREFKDTTVIIDEWRPRKFDSAIYDTAIIDSVTVRVLRPWIPTRGVHFRDLDTSSIANEPWRF